MMKLLLVGMGPGNGLSIARRFGREGFQILMIGRQMDKMAEFEALLTQEGIKSRSFAVNLADTPAYAELLEKIVDEHKDIEILHYNASAFNPATPSQIRIPVLVEDFRINVVGAVQAVQAVLPQMKMRQRGTIFLTGGGTAIHPPAMLASLGIGKAGMRNLAFSLAEECSPWNIRVATLTINGAVAPGTPFDPDRIADAFFQMYRRDPADWQTEVVFE